MEQFEHFTGEQPPLAGQIAQRDMAAGQFGDPVDGERRRKTSTFRQGLEQRPAVEFCYFDEQAAFKLVEKRAG